MYLAEQNIMICQWWANQLFTDAEARGKLLICRKSDKSQLYSGPEFNSYRAVSSRFVCLLVFVTCYWRTMRKFCPSKKVPKVHSFSYHLLDWLIQQFAKRPNILNNKNLLNTKTLKKIKNKNNNERAEL